MRSKLVCSMKAEDVAIKLKSIGQECPESVA